MPSRCDLEVRHLTFRYGEDAPNALSDVCLELQENQCLALVGSSGAGKSTLVHLLQRFWEYSEGSILLGGHELRLFRQEHLHRLISVVEQSPHLFNASLRENLLLARPEASQDELERAVRQACLSDCVQSLPQGYETMIGEQGLKLSGGERQRLAIARALLKNAPMLLLDEVTANLDPLTEREILQTVRTLLPGRTTILITHRLVGLEMADEILLLQAGKIKERGTHAELLQADGPLLASLALAEPGDRRFIEAQTSAAHLPSPLWPQDVPYSTHCMNEIRSASTVQFCAHVVHVDLDHLPPCLALGARPDRRCIPLLTPVRRCVQAVLAGRIHAH